MLAFNAALRRRAQVLQPSRFRNGTEEDMAQSSRDDSIQPAPPDAPIPPAGEPNTALSDAEQRHHRISEAAYYRAKKREQKPGQEQK